MPLKTTRRTALAAAMALTLSVRRPVGARQELGKIQAESPLDWFPPPPEDRADWPISILTYADIAGYWAANGQERPRAFDDETAPLWLEVSQRIPLNDGILFQYMVTEWDELIGLNPWDVDQVAVAFDPPKQIRVYAGAFDPERIANRLGSAGYEVRTEGKFTVLDNPSDDFDLTSELGRNTLGNFNHLAATETLVIASRSRSQIDGLLEIAAGDDESMADAPELADLATMIPDLLGFIIVNDALPAAAADQEDNPQVILHLAGYVTEETGASIVLAADLGDEVAALDAVAVVSDRIANDQTDVSQIPYADLLGDHEVDVAPGTNVLRVTVSDEEFATRWMQFVYTGDLRSLLRR